MKMHKGFFSGIKGELIGYGVLVLISILIWSINLFI